MLLLIQTLGALGGLLVLIAGIVGAKPFCGLKINPGDNLSTAQITGVVGALKAYLTWSYFYLQQEELVFSQLL